MESFDNEFLHWENLLHFAIKKLRKQKNRSLCLQHKGTVLNGNIGQHFKQLNS